MIERFDLYYSELIGEPLPRNPSTARRTREYRVLTGKTADELADFISHLSWSRSFWRAERVSILGDLCAHYPQIFATELSSIVSAIECAEVSA